MGSTISQNQPFEYASITYGFKSEFFASASAVHLTGYNPFIAFYSGSLNYTHVFNSWLDIAAGAYRYQIAPSLADTLFGSFTYGDLTVGLDWNLLYSKISAGGMLSDQNRLYLQIKNSRYFQTREFLKKKLYVSFDPYVSVLFGTLIEVETKTGTSIKVIPRYGRWKYFLQHTTYTSYNKKFGFMEVDFGVPVALNSDKMTIEAELCYLLPGYEDNDLPAPKGFVFLLGGIFRIF